jgi:hypothetical protein
LNKTTGPNSSVSAFLHEKENKTTNKNVIYKLALKECIY